MNDSVLAQLAALPGKTTPELKQLWRELYDREPPSYNRRFPDQAPGLPHPGTGVRRTLGAGRGEARSADAEEEATASRASCRSAAGDRPIAGTRLIREWQGVEHCVTVLDDGYEYQGRPYRSLSAIARAITGTRWNGPVFFGAAPLRSAKMKSRPVRKLRCAIYTRKSREEGLDQEFNSLDAQREAAWPTSPARSRKAGCSVADRYDDGGFSGGYDGAAGAAAAAARRREAASSM